IVLRCGKLSGSGPFGPWIRLYGPNNALLSQDFNASDAYLAYRAVTNGTFTVAIASLTAGQTGTFRLRFFKIPGTLTVSPGDEGGPLTSGGNYDAVTDIGDEDGWTFSANSGDYVVLRCGELSGTANYTPYIRLYGPDGTLLDSDFNANDAYIAYR